MSMTGKVAEIDPDKGFVFIEPDDGSAWVLVNPDDLCGKPGDVKPGTTVKFSSVQGALGRVAYNVSILPYQQGAPRVSRGRCRASLVADCRASGSKRAQEIC